MYQDFPDLLDESDCLYVWLPFLTENLHACLPLEVNVRMVDPRCESYLRGLEWILVREGYLGLVGSFGIWAFMRPMDDDVPMKRIIRIRSRECEAFVFDCEYLGHFLQDTLLCCHCLFNGYYNIGGR